MQTIIPISNRPRAKATDPPAIFRIVFPVFPIRLNTELNRLPMSEKIEAIPLSSLFLFL